MPSKDCVEEKIIAIVSYADVQDQTNTVEVRPYVIRSVCDLSVPSEIETKELENILVDMKSSQRQIRVDWYADIAYSKVMQLLKQMNLHIVYEEQDGEAGQFWGIIRGIAVGKYTKRHISIIAAITGNMESRESLVTFDAKGDDISMLPTAIEELVEGMKSWTCIQCGAPLDRD